MSAAQRLLPEISVRQLFKYVARYVRHSPAAMRAIPPSQSFRAPTEPGVGVFFLPSGSWTKTKAVAVGPLGETHDNIHPCKFEITRPIASPDPESPSLLVWGVGGGPRVVRNLTSGVAEGFAVTLELHGVGYRAEADEERGKLVLRLGFSHTIELPLEKDGVFFNVVNTQRLQVAGVNRADVHQMASKVRALRPPEPYKGKGVRYMNEPVRRKEAKKNK